MWRLAKRGRGNKRAGLDCSPAGYKASERRTHDAAQQALVGESLTGLLGGTTRACLRSQAPPRRPTPNSGGQVGGGPGWAAGRSTAQHAQRARRSAYADRSRVLESTARPITDRPLSTYTVWPVTAGGGSMEQSPWRLVEQAPGTGGAAAAGDCHTSTTAGQPVMDAEEPQP